MKQVDATDRAALNYCPGSKGHRWSVTYIAIRLLSSLVDMRLKGLLDVYPHEEKC